LLDEIDRVVHALQRLTFEFERAHAAQADSKEHGVMLFSQIAQRHVAAEHHVVLHFDTPHRVQPLHFALCEILDHLIRRDAIFIQAAGFGPGVEERDLVAVERQTMRTRQSRWPRADHRHMTSGVRRAFEKRLAARHRPVGGVALQRTDLDWFVILMIPDAGSLAENFSRTHACACAAQGIGRQDVHGRAFHVAVTNLADEAGNIYFCGACVDAGRVVAVVATARCCSRRGGIE